MAVESLSTLMSILGNVTSSAAAFTELIKKNRGETRILLEELKKNNTLCWLVTNGKSKPTTVIPKLSVQAYSRLLEKGFDFNRLSPRKKIVKGHPRLKNSSLSAFIGKDVANLVVGIYDRINEMQTILDADPANPHINWDRRMINLHKRILLLMAHLRGWTK
jgi:hypothetical protein